MREPLQPGRGALRVVRGVLLAVVCTLLAVAGHVSGGGDVPPLHALLTTAALLGAGFVVAADKRRSPAHIAAAAIGSQFLFHGVFAFTGHSSGWLAVTSHPGAAVRDAMPGVLPGVMPDLRMTLTHLVAAGVLALLASKGDDLLWAVAALVLGWRVPRLFVVRQKNPAAASIAHSSDVLFAAAGADYARIYPRRGPPAC